MSSPERLLRPSVVPPRFNLAPSEPFGSREHVAAAIRCDETMARLARNLGDLVAAAKHDENALMGRRALERLKRRAESTPFPTTYSLVRRAG
jgi:hypothetical protein